MSISQDSESGSRNQWQYCMRFLLYFVFFVFFYQLVFRGGKDPLLSMPIPLITPTAPHHRSEGQCSSVLPNKEDGRSTDQLKNPGSVAASGLGCPWFI